MVFPKKTVTSLMTFYKNMKTVVHSLHENIDFFDIVPEVLEGDTLEPYYC